MAAESSMPITPAARVMTRASKKLPANVRLLGAKRTAETDFADALFDGDEHDIHHADAANTQSKRANKKEQRFDSQRNSLVDGLELFPAKHGDGALVIRRKVLAAGDGRAKLLHGGSFKIRGDRFKQHHAGIARVP